MFGISLDDYDEDDEEQLDDPRALHSPNADVRQEAAMRRDLRAAGLI